MVAVEVGMVKKLITVMALSFLVGALIPLSSVAAPEQATSAVTKAVEPVAAGLEKPVAVQGFTDPTTGMEFVLVKGGCFQMGDTSGDGEGDEKPVHEVCVSDFAIGKYEVTNAQYRQFQPAFSSGDYQGIDLNGDNQPVVNVNYRDEAVAYAKWLSNNSGRNYRLPTEAEWEYAARAGTTARNYWGGDLGNPCAYANVQDMTTKRAAPPFASKYHSCNDGYKVSAPVGSFKPNAYGLYDMMGNVWEWVSDRYGSYSSGKQLNPQGPAAGWARVIRGGSWFNSPRHILASKRTYVDPGYRLYHLGFRLVSPTQ